MPLEDDVRELTTTQLVERYQAARAELPGASGEAYQLLQDEILVIQKELDRRDFVNPEPKSP
jgi:hypothetical protein